MQIRTGFGYDVHQLAKGHDLWLGGIKIPHAKGAVGHSDADVLLHVICDALLGAANLRDIGYHFPDTDPKYKGADSKILLRDTMKLVREKGWELGNIDSTIVAEQPKINPHVDEMKRCISGVLGVEEDQISIKATTNEKIGFLGREEGIAAFATILITKNA